jgi:hypothetical protein
MSKEIKTKNIDFYMKQSQCMAMHFLLNVLNFLIWLLSASLKICNITIIFHNI